MNFALLSTGYIFIPRNIFELCSWKQLSYYLIHRSLALQICQAASKQHPVHNQLFLAVASTFFWTLAPCLWVMKSDTLAGGRVLFLPWGMLPPAAQIFSSSLSPGQGVPQTCPWRHPREPASGTLCPPPGLPLEPASLQCSVPTALTFLVSLDTQLCLPPRSLLLQPALESLSRQTAVPLVPFAQRRPPSVWCPGNHGSVWSVQSTLFSVASGETVTSGAVTPCLGNKSSPFLNPWFCSLSRVSRRWRVRPTLLLPALLCAFPSAAFPRGRWSANLALSWGQTGDPRPTSASPGPPARASRRAGTSTKV